LKTVLVRTPGGPDVVEVCEAPVPEPSANEVLIKAEAFGVGQPDALIRKGIYKWMPPLPANPAMISPGASRVLVGAFPA
jgi:NADPH:quinone reductase